MVHTRPDTHTHVTRTHAHIYTKSMHIAQFNKLCLSALTNLASNMTNIMTNSSSGVYNFVSEVTNLMNLDCGATNHAFALKNYSHRAQISDHIPQPDGPRNLPHEVKIHAWIYGPKTLPRKSR